MNKEFIPYDLAKQLVELGFDEKCFDVYSDVKNRIWHIPRKRTPKILWQQAFRFFREKYNFSYHILKSFSFENSYHYVIFKYDIENEDWIQVCERNRTYEEAQQACLEKLIEIVKQN